MSLVALPVGAPEQVGALTAEAAAEEAAEVGLGVEAVLLPSTTTTCEGRGRGEAGDVGASSFP